MRKIARWRDDNCEDLSDLKRENNSVFNKKAEDYRGETYFRQRKREAVRGETAKTQHRKDQDGSRASTGTIDIERCVPWRDHCHRVRVKIIRHRAIRIIIHFGYPRRASIGARRSI